MPTQSAQADFVCVAAVKTARSHLTGYTKRYIHCELKPTILMSPIPQESLKALARQRGVSEVELDTLLLALDGMSTDAIASHLGISAIAVRKRLGEVYRKFEIGGSGPGKLAELKRILTSEVEIQQANPSPRQDWGEAPDVSVFYGRTEELNTIKQWIVKDGCRLVALLGMGGIGKTTLSVKLAKQIQDEFDYIIYRSLRNSTRTENFLADAIAFFSNQQESDLTEDVEERISQLIEYFRKHRCLVILDDVETILGSGKGRYLEGYDKYGVLFRRVGMEPHQSCFLINSQEQLKEVSNLASPNQPVRFWELKELNLEAAREILLEKGLNGEPRHWEELIIDYRGNPLALKIVAATIKDVFNGDIDEFIKYKTVIVKDVFLDILSQQFKRLSDVEKEILCALASAGKALSFKQLQANLGTSLRNSELIEQLQLLGGKSLIEKKQSEETGEALFQLQPVVKKYVETQILHH